VRYTLETNDVDPLTSGFAERSARGRGEVLTFARFVPLPENRAALRAVQDLAADLAAGRPRLPSPLFLHGPAGTGKTHLASALVADAIRQTPGLAVAVLTVHDLESDEAVSAARRSDLLVLEDVQHAAARHEVALEQLLDHCRARQKPVVCTATDGPGQLRHLSARLTSRLAAGLVVGLAPLQAPSRLALLQAKAQRRQLAVHPDVLAWLAEQLTGGRQLDGALTRLETLARLHAGPLDVATVAAHFRDEVEATRPTVERIAERVGGYFQVGTRQLQSRRRARHVLLPRQVGMYLARQLTDLSLGQIGAYFGGRDHSTVLHACRKVEAALTNNASLGGAVRQLQAELA
jgi:chromosomal replication initiator protein